MKRSVARKFVVVEGLTVVGSFVTLKDALEFRAKGASRSTRILVEEGESDPARQPGGGTKGVGLRQLIDDR